ncbi:MAG: hypothetical protein BWY68_00297 [bacterium ADurb.Bin400]|nr:MAG: hypothetical protein BWY68_00297 [bacterium ADurb.Bin400]
MPKFEFFGYPQCDRDTIIYLLSERLDHEMAKDAICLFHEVDMRWLFPQFHVGESEKHVRIQTSFEMSYSDSIQLAHSCIDLMDVELVLPNGVMVFLPKDSLIPRVSEGSPEQTGRPMLELRCDSKQELATAVNLARACATHIFPVIYTGGLNTPHRLSEFIPRWQQLRSLAS